MEKTASKTKIDRIFHALGDKKRLSLFKTILKSNTYCVSALADTVGITPAGTHQHLKIIEKAGLVKRVRNGHKVCYHPTLETATAKQIVKIISKEE